MVLTLFIKGCIMEKLKQELRQEAENKHGKIYPSGHRKKLDDCYTQHEGQLIFWFNLEDQTTRTLIREIEN
jgi:hypothetical protein